MMGHFGPGVLGAKPTFHSTLREREEDVTANGLKDGGAGQGGGQVPSKYRKEVRSI